MLMANEQNLKPFSTLNSEEARKRGAIGGSRKTPAKCFAARLRDLRKKGLTDDTAKRLYAMMTDAEYAAGDILLLLDLWKSKITTSEQYDKLIRCYIDWAKWHHGTKEKIDHKLDINVTDYKFIIDTKLIELPDDTSNSRDSIQTNEETIISLPIPSRPNDN